MPAEVEQTPEERPPLLEVLLGSLAAPARGWASTWILLFGALIGLGIVLGDYMGLGIKLAFVGLITAYSATSFKSGLTRAPISTVHVDDWTRDLVMPGFALLTLVILLLGIPFTVIGSLAEEAKAGRSTQIEQQLVALKEESGKGFRSKHQYFDGQESFKLPNGSVGRVTGTDPVIAERIGGGFVKVYPGDRYLMTMPPGYKRGDPEPVEPEAAWVQVERLEKERESFEELGRFELLAKLGMPMGGRFFLLILSLLVAIAFWPGALAAPVLTGEVIDLLNPLTVAKLATGARAGYVVAVVVGALIGLGPALLLGALGFDPRGVLMVVFLGPGNTALRLGMDAASDGIWLSVVLMLCVAYGSAVQAHFLGRLVATRPEVWSQARSDSP